MNYDIPKNEMENFISVYWQMMRELESQAKSKNDPYLKLLVKGAYKVLNRSGVYTELPEDI